MLVISAKVRQQIREALASEHAAEAETLTDSIEALLRRSSSDDGARQALQASVKAKYTPSPDGGYVWPWVRDVFHTSDTTGNVVWEVSGVSYQASYTLTLGTDGDYTAVLGPEAEVDVAYVPMTDAREGAGASLLSNEYSELVEGAVKPNGQTRLKLIKPGWGSSAHYPAEVLKEEGPLTFRKGMHMYWNHPGKEEAKNRPERDLRDLAAKLVEDAKWDDKGPKGPGLYANAEVFPHYRKFVDTMAPDIGVSIRGVGITEDGEAEGRKGKLLRHFGPMYSVDFVTAAGAGGEILGLFESARIEANAAPQPTPLEEGGESMALTAEERTALVSEMREAFKAETAELRQTVASLTEASRTNEARTFASAFIRTQPGVSKWPEEARSRVVEACALVVPLKEGAIDRESYAAQIKEAVKNEGDYIASIRNNGHPSGVFGMGGDSILTESDEDNPFGELIENDDQYKEALTGIMSAMTMSEAGVKVAVRGRV